MSFADSFLVDFFWEKKKYWYLFGFEGCHQSVTLCDSSCMLRTFKYTAT